jgi:hypothetical protein
MEEFIDLLVEIDRFNIENGTSVTSAKVEELGTGAFAL